MDGFEPGRWFSASPEHEKFVAHRSHVNFAKAGNILCGKIGPRKARTAKKELADSAYITIEQKLEMQAIASETKCERALSIGECYTYVADI